jgi:hypothetical protein
MMDHAPRRAAFLHANQQIQLVIFMSLHDSECAKNRGNLRAASDAWRQEWHERPLLLQSNAGSGLFLAADESVDWMHKHLRFPRSASFEPESNAAKNGLPDRRGPIRLGSGDQVIRAGGADL